MSTFNFDKLYTSRFFSVKNDSEFICAVGIESHVNSFKLNM